MILMDIQMPELDGLSATRRLRQSGCRMLVLALSAHAMKKEVRLSIEAGCDSHITKPVNKETLVNAIVEHLEQARIQTTSNEPAMHSQNPAQSFSFE